MAEKIAAELIGSLTLRTASLRVDEITVPPYAREMKIKSESMHIRFAMRFGDERSDEEVAPDAAGGVRRHSQGTGASCFQFAVLALCLGFNFVRAGRLRFSSLLPRDHPLEPAF